MTHDTFDDIRSAVRTLELAGRPVCLHSSLRSFGYIPGGALAVIEGFLAEGCTVMVPSFSGIYSAPLPPPEWRPDHNGWNYARYKGPTWPETPTGQVYLPETTEINKDMGAIPAALVRMPGRIRGNHPIGSFAAIGPLAEKLICSQTTYNVYAPLWELVQLGGAVALIGVGLDSMTLLHLAEQMAGRRPFVRWANGPDQKPLPVQDGGCSAGFEHFARALSPLIREVYVGSSRWQILPAKEALQQATEALLTNPELTRCTEPGCARCNDAILYNGPDYSIPIAQGAFPTRIFPDTLVNVNERLDDKSTTAHAPQPA